MNKSDFDHIVVTKQKNRDRLDELKIDLSVFLYACLIKRRSLKNCLLGMKEIFEREKFTHTNAIRARIGSLARKAYKQSSLPTKDHKGLVFDIVNKEELFRYFDKAGNEMLNEIETDMKNEVYENAMKEPEHIDDIEKERCFVLASRHDDCAKDHLDYQGKIYVKEWALKYKAVKDYCRENNIKTVEWVMGKPAWLTTRPNCRHFFKDVSLSDIKGSPLNVLLKEYGMDRVAGSRSAWQTAKHKTTKEWYTEQNIQRLIKKYKDRLKKHERMAEVYENENLKNEIAKDKLLINKWEIYLGKLNKK